MKHLAAICLLAVICLVKYPTDCTIVKTGFTADEIKFRAQVECTYEDGSRTVYFTATKKIVLMQKVAKVDFRPDALVIDGITASCE